MSVKYSVQQMGRSTHPAVKIGRLAVNKDYQGQKWGQKILSFLKLWFTQNNKRDVVISQSMRLTLHKDFMRSVALKYWLLLIWRMKLY